MCKHCESLTIVSDDKDDDFIMLHGDEIESEILENNSSLRLMSCGSIANADDREWFLKFVIQEEWTNEIPVTIGNYRDGMQGMAYKSREWFDCDEWFPIKYCPICGRELE